ncbi:nucleotidyltransferase domain-containing protein [Vulcanisaeta sp. JCM 14467]
MLGESLDSLGQFLRTLSSYLSKGDELLREYVSRLVREVPESTIVLFGSRARGDYLPSSDYDVAVVLRQVVNVHDEVSRLRSLKPEGLFLDLLVLSIDEVGDPVVKEMLRGCRLLYDGLGIGSSLGCRS